MDWTIGYVPLLYNEGTCQHLFYGLGDRIWIDERIVVLPGM